MVWLEIQEGKDRMKNKAFQNLGSTTACSLRGMIATKQLNHYPQDPQEHPPQEPASYPQEVPTGPHEPASDPQEQEPKRVYLGDSWFGSVKTAANFGKANQHAIMQVKTAHARFPKKFLEEKMKDYPGGTWITLEGHAEDEDEDLVALGYKYNKKTVLCFVTTRGAGTTDPGTPYEARFPDKYGNMCTRHVLRPHVIATFFKHSNVVDVHNQGRQFDLALEKKWLTMNPYFRLYTTKVGMIVTNVWKTLKTISRKKNNCLSIPHFGDELAYDIIKDAREQDEDAPSQVCTVIMSNQSDSISSMSNEVRGRNHTKINLPKGKQLRCIWCSRVNLMERKCTVQCQECNKGFCRDLCWSLHVAHGGVPAAPKRGTKKRKVGEDE